MNCKQYRAEIEAADFAAGHGAAPAGSHADGCAGCRAYGDETAAVRGLVAGLARVDAPPDFEFRLRARMGAADSARPGAWAQSLWPQNLLPRAAWLAGAGCLALAAALAWQTRDPRPTEEQRASARPAAGQTIANTAANANAGAATRGASGGESADVRAAGLTVSPAGSDKIFASRPKVRAAAVESSPAATGNAARLAQRRPAAATAAAQTDGEAAAPGGTPAVRTETRTMAMTGSPVIVTSAIPLPVSADERPLQVLFKDTQGESRVVNVDPVTFGSNEPAARPANVTFTKAAKKKQGVW